MKTTKEIDLIIKNEILDSPLYNLNIIQMSAAVKRDAAKLSKRLDFLKAVRDLVESNYDQKYLELTVEQLQRKINQRWDSICRIKKNDNYIKDGRENKEMKAAEKELDASMKAAIKYMDKINFILA